MALRLPGLRSGNAVKAFTPPSGILECTDEHYQSPGLCRTLSTSRW
ncbi:hypothetical protein CKO_04288 [Citrobacter koseri ATCC BAA-895]|uniref:Uncharacterized protein n=1 Tax=Citrobacter koseri (strain ATCC BAA-895 / CDC 4225-83 / SGSC4696) TaxID=290338 RepID=A8APD2_CITK8|nr:hypothetical protein CKO_04288 [Citrobacter koseri ATCC BAA-895]